MDPSLSLAFAMHANRGVYAVLLGSGVSRGAAIPSGWEVVLDLTQKLAAVRGEDCAGDPEGWYTRTFAEPPDYAKLLKAIARSPAERQQLLRGYFEPTDDDATAGRKQPTKAHETIAALVKSGHIRVIVTTNFDRLMERSLETVGISPIVISTPDGVAGALPLTHAPCTVVKLHGDYLDTRIKNTPAELARYDPKLNRLLDRVFDEFGLIVCGWSADWDDALRSALMRCKSRRFTTYWTARGDPTAAAKALIRQRAAELIAITDADSFLSDLRQKLLALAAFDPPHPLSSKTAVATMKRLLSEDRHRIELHDLVKREVERVMDTTSDARMPVSGDATPETMRQRMGQHEAVTSILRDLFVTGCYWGQRPHDKLWVSALERLANRPDSGGVDWWLELRNYPALIVLYAGGIAALARPDYACLKALLFGPRLREPNSSERNQRPLDVLYPQAVMEQRRGQAVLLGKEQHKTPLNQYLFESLRDPLRELLPDEEDYQRTFDRFEYLFAVCSVAAQQDAGQQARWAPLGCFSWRRRFVPAMPVADALSKEADEAGVAWEPLASGLFASRAQFDSAAARVAELAVAVWRG